MSKLEQLQALREAKISRGSPKKHSAHVREVEQRDFIARSEAGPAGLISRKRHMSLAGVAPSPREAKPGRPLDVDKAKTLTATKPWAAAGMSRRTWYRRRAEKRAT